jgi:6-pyruvoyl-tetrahydropterin synthase
MYFIGVRDHFMIAHSFKGEIFGPAQRLHGATYVVDLELRRVEPDPDGVVVDIGKASASLRAILEELNYRNLDEVPAFTGHNTTTEFLARVIAECVEHHIHEGRLGPYASGLHSLRVTLHESHIAWAAYEKTLV